MPVERNLLEQPNKYKWRDNPPKVDPEEIGIAIACAREADKLKCDCWNTKCPNFGDCRKCIVYEMCLGQLPTCERDLFEELKEHYIAYCGKKV